MGQCISSEEEKNIAPGNVEESDSGNKGIKLSKKMYTGLLHKIENLETILPHDQSKV